MILFDENNLSPVRRRTLERLTSAALKLYQEQKFPSPEEITREAEYAKVTLKSYFSTHSEFVEYVVKQVINAFNRPEMNSMAEENIEKLLTWGFGELDTHEALMRDAMRISQQRWQAAISENSDPLEVGSLKKSNRKIALTEALSPLENQLPEETRRKLVMLMSVLYGTEAMTVLKDSFGLNKDEIADLTVWGAKLMLRQVLEESNNQ
ncbi:TetR/AcrR family transcriptional regulator [Serratia fonticola]|uniref:TetR/AcrR family transcriptional regulator n=1 Tax=Serratia fonticola TaxID=47917 RepID=A0AAW3WKF8_SERFO|nr:TetR/AcrR family transcriptional regulator [Serratia fonticola]MBC3211027.1 TetR/AcrR family transcriptional regulator [Serratia fonticola]NYA12009.1 TetR/AcrR family transcriptional regulator [Serratia fonticola]NYA31588.1 TetR/AcrR family transcriptional regulator [Serratia fonticola]